MISVTASTFNKYIAFAKTKGVQVRESFSSRRDDDDIRYYAEIDGRKFLIGFCTPPFTQFSQGEYQIELTPLTEDFKA